MKPFLIIFRKAKDGVWEKDGIKVRFGYRYGAALGLKNHFIVGPWIVSWGWWK
ncbi:hypothetical protein [Mesorhizobium sp. SARCC-RB16n]|uniref:hypothetical protein n=1 Tax=Mesorhizobium sp. SARCC-RB16n TaxID=2116687 RepID=UPI00166D101E|nr:hypothetical protein [Mesorhizobium sp. SARCC-RB16n]